MAVYIRHGDNILSDTLNYDTRGGPRVTCGIAAVLADGLFCTLDAEFL